MTSCKDSNSSKLQNITFSSEENNLPFSFCERQKRSKLRKLEGRSRLVDITLLPKLRIVKRDIRRQYIEMYNNVMNHTEPDLLFGFLQDFCTPNVEFVVHIAPGISPRVRRGVAEIVCQEMEYRAIMPDGVQYLSDAKIHVSLSKPGSRIISSVTVKCTELYEIKSESPLMNYDSLKSVSCSSRALHNSSSKSEDCSDKEKNYIQTGDDERTVFDEEKRERKEDTDNLVSKLLPKFESMKLTPLKEPREFVVEGVFVIELNEANRVERFIMDTTRLSMRDLASEQR